MTDSSDPRRSKSSRKRHSREPATIDLKATVIDDGTIQDSAQGSTGEDAAKDVHVHDAAAQDVVAQEAASQESPLAETPQGAPLAETSQEARPEETIAGSVYPTAEDVVASPEATLDSGTGTDTLPTGDPSVEPLTHDTVSQGGSFQGAPSRNQPPRSPLPRMPPCRIRRRAPSRPSPLLNGAARRVPSSAPACSAVLSERGSYTACKPGRPLRRRMTSGSSSWSSA
ncbi:hypothetical protein ACFQY9_00910 [Microvirga aerilata]|uniref:hypothetical protein n=1 Tax=Microvirga aerilata TaxID=670292 RepID=UPI0036320041